MEEPVVKGTVTSLSSMFPVEETQKAAKRVQDMLAEKQQDLNRVGEFIDDNTKLINLVQKLPEELHHDIMVPFGKAAFFPGRLVHTNEILVLLGEGYYADRTSRQTVEILMRRGKVLESQADSLKAMMQDLRAEASFFDATASEGAEGLVEIREEYVEEKLSKRASESGPPKQDSPEVEDEEYARIMSRFDELEQEELAAEGDEDKQSNAAKSDSENDEDKQADVDFDQFSDQISLDHNPTYSEEFNSGKAHRTKQNNTASKAFSDNYHRSFADQSCTGLASQAVPKDVISPGKNLAENLKPNSVNNSSKLPEVKENVKAANSSRKEVSVPTSKPGFDYQKAFTGSVVEHAHNIQTNAQETSSKPSRPVSRFKLQRK